MVGLLVTALSIPIFGAPVAADPIVDELLETLEELPASANCPMDDPEPETFQYSSAGEDKVRFTIYVDFQEIYNGDEESLDDFIFGHHIHDSITHYRQNGEFCEPRVNFQKHEFVYTVDMASGVRGKYNCHLYQTDTNYYPNGPHQGTQTSEGEARYTYSDLITFEGTTKDCSIDNGMQQTSFTGNGSGWVTDAPGNPLCTVEGLVETIKKILEPDSSSAAACFGVFEVSFQIDGAFPPAPEE